MDTIYVCTIKVCVQNTPHFSVIDQMFSAMLSQNESKARLTERDSTRQKHTAKQIVRAKREKKKNQKEKKKWWWW